MPFVSWWILKKIGPGRARKLKEGGDGYSVKLFSFKNADKPAAS